MTSVFPTTPINICSLLSFGILFVLIIPLELHWDNRNETRGILPPSHTLHLHNLSRAARRSFESRPPFIHLIFPGQVLSWVVALSTELFPEAERHLPLQNHLSPACLLLVLLPFSTGRTAAGCPALLPCCFDSTDRRFQGGLVSLLSATPG